MESKPIIAWLEGGKEIDFRESFRVMKDSFNIVEFKNLYTRPGKLKKLPVLNPDYLFIGTTGSRIEKREVLLDVFRSLGYTPKAVIFHGENSAMTYLGIARELKKLGTKFYYPPHWEGDKLREICWI